MLKERRFSTAGLNKRRSGERRSLIFFTKAVGSRLYFVTLKTLYGSMCTSFPLLNRGMYWICDAVT